MTTLTLETHLERGSGPLRSMQMIATFSPNMLSNFLMELMMMMVKDLIMMIRMYAIFMLSVLKMIVAFINLQL